MRTRLLITVLLLLLSAFAGRAQVGGEFADLERAAAARPREVAPHVALARAYGASGFIEEAVAEYLAALDLDPDTDVRPALDRLLQQRMPKWLPAATARTQPFPLKTMKLTLPVGEGPPWEYALLATADFAAHEGERQDRLHEWRFPRIAYGYLLSRSTQRWEVKVRVHAQAGVPNQLAQDSLTTVLALLGTVHAKLQLDPTRRKGPIDVWLCEEGTPGARTVGLNIYLYSVATERTSQEWLREVAHEYGHLSLPGVGGYTKTDDVWADGNLGELLFVKWLAPAQAEWLPWPVAKAEAAAQAPREQLLTRSPRPDPKLLRGQDEQARAHFLGLALRTEAAAGPKFLGEVLSRCPRGNAAQFVAEAEKLAKARGVRLW